MSFIDINGNAKFDFLSDAGHGWLRVPREYLNNLNILSKISSYSYQEGKYVYLEEDQDAGIFIDRFVEVNGIKPIINYCTQSNSSSYVRNLNDFLYVEGEE